MPNLQQIKTELPVLAGELKSLYKTMENSYIRVCETMGDAREYFEDDDDFWEWVEAGTPFKKKSANEYLQVYRSLPRDRSGGYQSLNSIPFKSLLALSKQDLPKSIQRKVFKLYEKAEANPAKHKRPTLEDVKRIVRDGARGNPRPLPLPIARILPSFSERLQVALKNKEGIVGGAWLFALHSQCPPEDIRLYTKIWLQKYHPDKQGGSKKAFLAIKRISDIFIAEQIEAKTR